MASYSPHRQKQLSRRRLAFTIILILFAVLLARQLLSKANLHHKHPRARSNHAIIGGRWKAARASLGLPPLPDTINPSIAIPPPLSSPSLRTGKLPTRFDLRRKRAEEDFQSQSMLHLAADATSAPRVPLEALAASFRRIAAAEKEMAEVRVKRDRVRQKGRAQKGIEDWQADPRNAKNVYATVTND
ncbi:hypothetical protein AZE42_01810 [Rhizopogon vesiculosus]|uniref:Uncharacterized protein n=1 Tax=Rhizopogon vesiculosus TaxID=180088 RepID=A0A1J8QNT9_9AGAM|nr:hypothetical protein AZE42_01810 [Rhizopogon vesiculosus]